MKLSIVGPILLMREGFIILLTLIQMPQLFAATIDFPVPSGLLNGNQATTLPFSSSQPVRYQEVFSASEFSLISTGGGYIAAIGFRGDETLGGGGGAISNLQMSLSTTLRGPDGLSALFSDNVGADNKIVFGPKGLMINSSPGSYLTSFTLSQPFFYNPNLGNLLLDVDNTSGIDFIGNHFFEFDAQLAIGDTISSVYALGGNASSGTAQTSGLLAEFIVTPVPEPSTLALAGCGTLVLLVVRYIQTKTKTRKGRETWHEQSDYLG